MLVLLLVSCQTPAPAGVLAARFVDTDKQRTQIPVGLSPVAEGLEKVTDIQFASGRMFVATQPGRLAMVDGGVVSTWLDLPVIAGSERGLLGVAFHPAFETTGRVFLSYTVKDDGKVLSRLAEFRTAAGKPAGDAPLARHQVLFEVEQPWGNHNGGSIQFGPDGKLYMGLGDGGKWGDPQGNGQNVGTALGAMLRFDVDLPAPHVPADNPFVGRAGADERIWAIGLRNPWRFSFDSRGRLVAADVGQNSFEELTFVPRGANLGWDHREGRVCYEVDPCPGDFVDPFYVYPRDEGTSVTGGYVWTAEGPLKDLWVFGDFSSGRLWAVPLPEKLDGPVESRALGKFPINPSTFGRDAAGKLYVGDYSGGRIYAVEAAAGP